MKFRKWRPVFRTSATETSATSSSPEREPRHSESEDPPLLGGLGLLEFGELVGGEAIDGFLYLPGHPPPKEDTGPQTRNRLVEHLSGKEILATSIFFIRV